MRILVRVLRDKILLPGYVLYFKMISLERLIYLASFIYHDSSQETSNQKRTRRYLGTHTNLACKILNERILALSSKERDLVTPKIWQQDAVKAWSERAFLNPEQSSKGYAYEAINKIQQNLKRPLSVLELGCVNGIVSSVLNILA